MDHIQDAKPIISERGMGPDGKPVYSDRRLYITFLAYGGCRDHAPVIAALETGGVTGTVYADINDPLGIGLAVASEDPNYFVGPLRDILAGDAFAALVQKPEYTMLGRSYSIGYETDLDRVLVDRPRERLVAPQWPWAVWYPLRRHGSFALLDAKEQRDTLMEHGRIGNAFGEADYPHDIRLACHGLDKNDNDFVVALLGKELHPLSVVVQTMRKTKQTSTYLASLGPFFIGKALWQKG